MAEEGSSSMRPRVALELSPVQHGPNIDGRPHGFSYEEGFHHLDEDERLIGVKRREGSSGRDWFIENVKDRARVSVSDWIVAHEAKPENL